MGHKVVLVHGYCRTHRDMVDLKKNLELYGYNPILMNLPLTFQSLECAGGIFEDEMNEIFQRLEGREKVSLVGHSTGGLIIRLFLSNTNQMDRIHRCVQIATPNAGSQLADRVCNTSKLMVNTFRTIKSLTAEKASALPMMPMNLVDIGAIIGNKNNLILGRLLKEESDGRVEIDSAIYKDLKDAIILPYNHNEIHHRTKTAKYVHQFLSDGKFYS